MPAPLPEQKVKKIVELARDGLSAKDISERLDIGRTTVYSKLRDSDIDWRKKRKPLTAEEKNKITELYERGNSMEDVADKIDVGETVVHKILHNSDVKVRSRSKALSGYEKSDEHRKKISEHHKSNFIGENNPNWRGGKTSRKKRIRSTKEYEKWRKKVFERDDYTCQDCGEKGCYLEAHHIKPLAFFPDLATEVDNGKTLCRSCHKATFWGTTKEQYLRKNMVNSEDV